MKILILASNPRKDLNLDREIRDLKDVIEKSRYRAQFEVVTELAVRVGDLQDLMLRHEPQIVHFCGHGGGEEGLVFASDEVKEQWLRTEALSDLFRLCASHLECVLLNACYSEVQANAMIEHINYVIGMRQTIQDNAAIAFSKGFYRALGYNRSIEESHEFGCNAIKLEITGSSKVRSTATEEVRKAEVVEAIQQTAIPEDLKPILKIKSNLTPRTTTNRAAAAQPLSQETLAIHLDIDRALGADTKVKQYRDRLREFLSDRKLSTLEKIRLERLRKDLGLSEAEANRILAEEMEPIQRSQDEYEAMLIGLIEAGHYPLDADTQAELLAVQQELGLTEEEVEAIAPPILAAAEEEHQARLVRQRQQEYDQKLQRYEQEFRKAIAAHYPIEQSVRAGLISFQQSLGLGDEDVARIEQPLLAPKEAEYQRRQSEQRQLQQEQALEQQREQERQREEERKRELEQRQREEQRKREEAKRQPSLKTFEFQVPKVNIGSQTIEKPGLFGKKTETVTTLNITYQRGQAEYFIEDLGGGVMLEMVAIAPGTFRMGSSEDSDEQPQHQVTVQRFFMGKFAVTQAQYEAIMGKNPAHFKGEKRPVESVSWHEAVEFCDRLTQKTGKNYRLPSEAEWEYACRAGTTTPFHCGETIATDLANYDGKRNYGSGTKGIYRETTLEVGSFPPNAFGLYDMHGNVSEWCADHWHENYQGAPADGSAWITGGDGDCRLWRGGSWCVNPWYCRSAYRGRNAPAYRDNNYGFRVVCSAA